VRCVNVACVSTSASKSPLPRERTATTDIAAAAAAGISGPSPTSATKSISKLTFFVTESLADSCDEQTFQIQS
jgi:hypothetical protein